MEEEKREKREEREEEEEEEEEEEIEAESDYLEDPGDETHLVEIEEMEKENGIKLESCCEERMKTEVEKAAKELIKLEKEEKEKEAAYGEYFVVSEKMEEGRIETQIEEAAEELSEFSQHTTSNKYPDWDYDAYEWSEMQDLKKKMNKEQKKEIRGARADKVSGVFKICEEYGQIKEKLTGLWMTCETYTQNIRRLKENKRKREEEKEEEEQSRKKLKIAKRELLWESYLKLKMIKEDNVELLKLLQVCQVMEKIKKM